jgi:crotonobetainyl-CoA:carnitine CoA-transferase CaiB-like acyl-CoA transferase
MLLADLGATVIRVDRKTPADIGWSRPRQFDVALRNRKSIRVDLKDPRAVALVLELIDQSDGLIEGFRPGVTERLGLGPDTCLARNPRLVYGRVTGWGQTGPLAQSAAHDINYIAISGALAAIGRRGQPPTPPLNVLGDYAGGALYLAFGLVTGILEARSSGKGQVVDAAIVDGVASLLSVLVGLRESGMTGPERGTNMLDSGAPFYDVYECADGKYVSVGAIERRFYLELLRRLQLDDTELADQMNKEKWPRIREVLEARFRSNTQAHWCGLLEGLDVCFAPVLDLKDAYQHAHLAARGTFTEVNGVIQPAPGPRFSRTPAAAPLPPTEMTAENSAAALQGWLPQSRILSLAQSGVFQ